MKNRIVARIVKSIKRDIAYTLSLMDDDPYTYDSNGEPYDMDDIRYWGNPERYTLYEVSQVHPEWSLRRRLCYKNVLENTIRIGLCSLIMSIVFFISVSAFLLVAPM